MATSQNDIREWLQQGISQGSKYVIVAVDTFDYGDFPVYVNSDEDFPSKYAEYDGKNMHRIMEVYDLSLDIETQLNESRAFHYPPGFLKG